ncbi:MAG: hypothetical protein ACPG5P_00775, partial [Saprospiraceae bacterium]
MPDSERLHQDMNRLFVLEDFLEKWAVLFQGEKSPSFVFRGSLILRQWVFPSRRIVKDLDILSLVPIDADKYIEWIVAAGKINDENGIVYHTS